nr:hypothetical protein [Tanacetum cinerariifolium]
MSDDGSLDVGSLGVVVLGYDGLPMMPEDPYAYVEAATQEPPPLYFVPELVYPEFMPPEDDEDPDEEDDEDPEEDLADYPTYRDNDVEEEESFGDDANDKEEDDDEDKKEEDEHLALADSVDRLVVPTLPPSPLTSYSSPLPHIPSPPLPTSPTDAKAPLGYKAAMIRLRAESPFTSHPLPLPPSIVLLRIRASMVMMRAAALSNYILAPRSKIPPSETPPLLPIPLPTSSPPLLLPSADCRADVLEIALPPRKRLCIAIGPRFKVEECSSALTARPTRGYRADYGFVGTLDAEIRRGPNKEIGYEITNVTDEIYEKLDDARDDRLLMSGQLYSLRRNRRSHARTARLMESEAWVQSMDASDTARSKVRALQTTVLAQ